MRRTKIERLFKSGEYQNALEGLETSTAAAWVDTTRLRCMRAMGHADTVNYADQLKTSIKKDSFPYSLNTSERNNLLRYIALIYSEQNRPRDACAIIAKLCRQNPHVAALHREYAFALANLSLFDKAESQLNRAIELQANNVNSHAQLAHIYCRTGRVNAGWHSYSRAAILEPDNPTYIQRLVFWSNYTERSTEQSNYQLTQLWANKAFADTQASDISAIVSSEDRRLKIGLVSSNFNDHPISFTIIPLLEGLNKSQFEVTIYSDTKKVDQVTQTIRRVSDLWCECSSMSDGELAEQIVSDKMDVLVDLNGHNRGNRLAVFARRVAPVQLSWLGYPSSTGVKSITYRISDHIVDPKGTKDHFYGEELLRLQNGFLCYMPPETTPDIEPVESESIIRFGSFNSLDKVSNLTLDCWAAALLVVPKSTLTIKHQQLTSKRASKHLVKELSERGINRDRIILKPVNEKNEIRLNGYNNIDIALDTSPYNETISALEALWMGVPVISLSGQTHASRLTESILHRLELDHLATRSIFEYAERAQELAARGDFSLKARTKLRQRMSESTLMNKDQFAREFGNVLRLQWQKWCRVQNEPLNENSSSIQMESRLNR